MGATSQINKWEPKTISRANQISALTKRLKRIFNSPMINCYVLMWPNRRRSMRSQSDPQVINMWLVLRSRGAIWITAFGWTKPSFSKNPNPWRLLDPLFPNPHLLSHSVYLSLSPLAKTPVGILGIWGILRSKEGEVEDLAINSRPWPPLLLLRIVS